MSGTEAVAAIQLIDACTGIANDIGRAVHDVQGIPPKLQTLLQQLPAIQDLLEHARENFEGEKSERRQARVRGPSFHNARRHWVT